MPGLTVTVVIPTRNRPESLGVALASLEWQTHRVDYVLVVDDSDESYRGEVEAAVKGSTLTAQILVAGHKGLTRCRNLGVRASDTDVVVFIDDDVILHPRYVEKVLHTFDDDHALSGVGGVICDGPVARRSVMMSLLGLSAFSEGRVLKSGWSSALPTSDAPVQYLSGCNMAFRREVLRSYSFDEDHFSGYSFGEDLEFTARISRAGHQLRVCGEAMLWHLSTPHQKDDEWGHHEAAIRKLTAGDDFNVVRFVMAICGLCGHHALTGEFGRARGNIRGAMAVLRK
jgi:GT2 family glycosyltransferase